MKKILFFAILFASIIIINNLLHSIFNLWQKQELLTKAEKQLQKQKQDNESLKRELTRVQNPQFIEEEARNKLSLGKPGESFLLVPSVTGTQAQLSTTNKRIASVPNWRQWWNLFF